MSERRRPAARLRLPDGQVVEAGPDAIVGRSAAAEVHIDDARVSSVHAEISWRAEGLVLLARGGRLLVDGRATPSVLLGAGLIVGLVPGLAIEVLDVREGDARIVPPTSGRERLHFAVEPAEVVVSMGTDDAVLLRVGGVPGRILAELLRVRDVARPWDQAAEAVWPAEGAIRRATREQGASASGWTEIDERRLRNRWDQHLVALRGQLASLREGQLLDVRHGTVQLALRPDDVVVLHDVTADPGPAGRR